MTEEEHNRKIDATKHMTEFVIKIDNCFSAPVLNTGVFLKVGDAPYLIINTEDFGAFLTTDQLVTIEKCIKDNNPALINKINPYVRCIRCHDVFDRLDDLRTNPAAGIMIAVSLYPMYKALPYTESGKAEYSNFVSRFHVYFTGVPAGLNMGTTILLNHISNSPKDWSILPTTKRYLLVGFYPDHKKLIVRALNNSINMVVDAAQFSIVDEMDKLSAGITRTIVHIISHCDMQESTYKQAINLLKSKLPKEKVVPQKKTPIKIVDLKELPPGAGLKFDKNPPPLTTNKVNKKKTSKSKPKASK